MLKGLLMASGYLVLYIVYGKDGSENEKYGVPTVLGCSLLFTAWLFSVILLFLRPTGSALIVCLSFAILIPLLIAIWSVRARKKAASVRNADDADASHK